MAKWCSKARALCLSGAVIRGRWSQWIDYGNALIGPGFIDLDALGDLTLRS
jgi:hypothetical protein